MRARLPPTFVHVTCVPAVMFSVLGLNGPPPPLIVMLAKAIGLQLDAVDGLALKSGEGGGSCALAVAAESNAIAQ